MLLGDGSAQAELVSPSRASRYREETGVFIKGPAATADMSNQSGTVFTGYTGRISMTLSFGWLVALLGRGVLSPLLPAIIDSVSITAFQAGGVLTLMMILHSIVQYPAGAFSDQLSRTTVLVASLAVLTLGFAVLVVTTSYWLLLTGAGLIGLGTGLYFTPQRSMLSDLFVERRGRAFGINFAAGSLGSALSGGLAIVVLARATWQQAFVPLVFMTVFVLFLLHTWSREEYVFDWVTPDVGDTVRRIAKSTELRWLIVAYALFSFTWNGIVGFLPVYLQATKALSPAFASAGFTLLFVVAMVVMPLAGNLSDSIARPKIAMAALATAVAGLSVLVLTTAVPVVFFAIMLFAVGIRAYPPVMQAHLMDIVPDENTGGDFGAIKTVYTLIGSSGPLFVGFVAGNSSYDVAFGGLLASLVLSIGISLWLSRK